MIKSIGAIEMLTYAANNFYFYYYFIYDYK